MAEITITGWETKDVRFPTSLDKTGSDAMNAAGDYSAAYCILQTDSKFSGHGMVYLNFFCPHLHYRAHAFNSAVS
jgi:L-galactonate dehydratase